MNNNHKVYVGNLPPDAKEEALKIIFEKAGVTPLKIVMRRNYAFVDLPEEMPVQKAVEALNGMQFCYKYTGVIYR